HWSWDSPAPSWALIRGRATVRIVLSSTTVHDAVHNTARIFQRCGCPAADSGAVMVPVTDVSFRAQPVRRRRGDVPAAGEAADGADGMAIGALIVVHTRSSARNCLLVDLCASRDTTSIGAVMGCCNAWSVVEPAGFAVRSSGPVASSP